MRLGVLDVGSNTIHLQVVEAHPGARPSPTTNHKVELRLTEFLDSTGAINSEGIALLFKGVDDAVAHAQSFQTEELLAFATSALREATNGLDIIAAINKRHELDLQILSGDEEARITFLAVRRWLGWSSGKLLVLDIGGGSLELATGDDESPDTSISLPLGAARLTREFLSGDPFTSKSLKNLEMHVKEMLKSKMPTNLQAHQADHFIGTSKTFRTLARLANHWYGDNPQYLEANALLGIIPRLIDMPSEARAKLPGVSASRAQQIVSGAIVAGAAMEKLKISEVEICPWALREGVILKWLDWNER
jgi:exopolyphosphatase / guanosine-5'-triphosphate,3'-diphosphate pyrophosphatase